jgi:regulatory protein
MLGRREHSVAELQDKLIRKGHAEAAVHQAVVRLRQDGLVSDERFTEMLLNARSSRGVGPLRIRQELLEKGIAEELINQRLDVSGREWIEQIRRVKQKKFGDALPANYAERARQTRFLQYRGFTLDQIRRVLNVDDAD